MTRIGLCQLNVTDDPERNLVTTLEAVRLAATQGADFVLTPEVTNCVSTSRTHTSALFCSQSRTT